MPNTDQQKKYSGTVAWICQLMGSIVLVVYTLILLRSLLGNRVLYWGDILVYFEPMYRLGRTSLLAGKIPLWNPYVLCGQPFLGNPQMGVFYPSFPFLYWLGPWRYITLFVSVHVYFCGLFTFCFLRRWVDSASSALIGAMIYEGSGCVIGRMQFPPMVFTLAYLPLLLYTTDLWFDTFRWGSLLGLGVGVGLMLLAAHPNAAYLNLLCWGVYALFRFVALKPNAHSKQLAHRITWRLIPCLLAVIMGVMLASIQLLPMFQLFRSSPRQSMTIYQANRFVLTLPHLITVLWPHFDGSPADRNFWGAGNIWEADLYIGWIPLALIVIAAANRSIRRWDRLWLGIGTFTLWLSWGTSGLLYFAAYLVLPGLSSFHDPARFLTLSVFAAAMLAAAGLDVALYHSGRSRNCVRYGSLLLTAVPLLAFSPSWLPTASIKTLSRAANPIVSSARLSLHGNYATGRIWTPRSDYFSSVIISDGYMDYGSPDSRQLLYERRTSIPNLQMDNRLESASGYEPVPLTGPLMLESLCRFSLLRSEPGLLHQLQLLGVSDLILPRALSLTFPELTEVKTARVPRNPSSPLRIFRNEALGARAWIVHRSKHIMGSARYLTVLSSATFNPLDTALIPGQVDRRWANMETYTMSDTSGSKDRLIIRPLPDSKLDIMYDCPTRSNILICSLPAYPGWKASIDGINAEIYSVDGGLIGIYLPSGNHRIFLSYSPDTFRIGGYVTLVTVCLLSALLAARAATHRFAWIVD